jgi:hypothetical protein
MKNIQFRFLKNKLEWFWFPHITEIENPVPALVLFQVIWTGTDRQLFGNLDQNSMINLQFLK